MEPSVPDTGRARNAASPERSGADGRAPEAQAPTILPCPELDWLASNLSAPATSFVGRRVEVESVAAALGAARLVTLTGPGGCGKSRLAIEVARG
jgi:hypothetical protein